MTLEKFEHQGFSVWNGELFGHDVTISRQHGAKEFKIWIDTTNRGSELSFLSASTRAHKLLS